MSDIAVVWFTVAPEVYAMMFFPLIDPAFLFENHVDIHRSDGGTAKTAPP